MSESRSDRTVNPDEPGRSVLIAGCGYVGHRAARVWQSRGWTTWAITRSESKSRQLCSEGLRPIVLNLGSADSWPELPDVDVVLWSVGFERSATSMATAAEERQTTWVSGLQRLLERLPDRPTPRRIIYTSSTGVYGDGDGQDVDEFTPVNPQSEGGAACVQAEAILQEHGRRLSKERAAGDLVYILRLAGIYGPGRLLRRVADLRAGVPLTSAPDEWLNLIHVDDAVRVITCLATIEPPAVWGHSTSNPRFAAPQPDAGACLMNVVAAVSVTRRTYYSILADQVRAPAPVFVSRDTTESDSSTRRGRNGNRRVVSVFRSQLPVEFQFDDCALGLSQAIAEVRPDV